MHAGVTDAFASVLKGVGDNYPMMKVVQVVGGLPLLTNRFAPFAAVILFPISLNLMFSIRY